MIFLIFYILDPITNKTPPSVTVPTHKVGTILQDSQEFILNLIKDFTVVKSWWINNCLKCVIKFPLDIVANIHFINEEYFVNFSVLAFLPGHAVP